MTMKTNNNPLICIIAIILVSGCHKTQSPPYDPLANTYKMQGSYNMAGYFYPYIGYNTSITIKDSIYVVSKDRLFVYTFYTSFSYNYDTFYHQSSDINNNTITFIGNFPNVIDTLTYNYATGKLRHARIDANGLWYTNSQ